MSQYQTINTFTQTPSPAQLVAYSITLLHVLTFYIIIQSRLQSPVTRTAMLCLYSVLVAGQFIVTFLVSLSDPSDDVMIAYRGDRNCLSDAEIEQMLYCDFCQSYVHSSSRHCRLCKRCVSSFDHHCMWVNNCVGGKNYRMFLAMILFTFGAMVAYLIALALLWTEGFFAAFLAEMGVVWATGLIVVVFTLLLLNLILLHVYLNVLGITTYEFIMRDREQKRIEAQLKIASEQEITKETTNYAMEYGNKTEQKDVHMSEIIQVGNGSMGKSHNEGNRSENSSQKKIDQSKIMPLDDSGNRQNIFEEEYESVKSGKSSKQSVRISEFFTKNKSLRILMNSDADQPEKAIKQIRFPQTTNNAGNVKLKPLKNAHTPNV